MRLKFLDRNPFFWLAIRAPFVVWETWLILLTVLLLALWAGWFFHTAVPVFVVSTIVAVTLHAILKMQLCAAACQRLAEDKEAGTLEVLLATPLTITEIVRGQWLALVRQFLGPLIAVIAIQFLLLALALVLREQDFFNQPDSAATYVWVCAATALMLGQDLLALGWVSMWQALSAKNVMLARSRTLFASSSCPGSCSVWFSPGLGCSGRVGYWASRSSSESGS